MKSKKVKEHIITNFLKGVITNADDKIIPNEAISNMYTGKVSTFGINCGYYVEPNKETLPVLLGKDEIDGCLISNLITPFAQYNGRFNIVFGKEIERNWYSRRITLNSQYSANYPILIRLNLDLRSFYTNNKLSDDFSELRFTLDADGTQHLPHYIFTHPYPKYGNINRSQYVVYILLPSINQGENYIYMWYTVDDSIGNFNSVKNTFNVQYDNLNSTNEDFQRNFLSENYKVIQGIFKSNVYNGYKVWSLGGAYMDHIIKITPQLYTDYFRYYFKFITAKTQTGGNFLFKVFLNDTLKIYIKTSYDGINVNYEVWVNGAVISSFSIPAQTELNFGSADFNILFNNQSITIYRSTDGGLNWTSLFTFSYTFDKIEFKLEFSPKSNDEYIHLIHFFGISDYRIAYLSSYSVDTNEVLYESTYANSYAIVYKSPTKDDWVYKQLKIGSGSYMDNSNPRCALWDDKIFITSASKYQSLTNFDVYGGLYYISRKYPNEGSINYVDYFFDPNPGFNMIRDTGLIDINIYKNFMFVFSPIYIFWSDFSNPLVWDSGLAGNSMLGNLNTDYIVKTLVYKDTLFIFTKWKIYALEWAGYPTLWKITPVVELTKEFYDAVVSSDFIYVLLKGDYFYLYEFNGYSLKLLNYEILNKCIVDDNAEFFIDFEGYVHLITNRNLITYDPYLKLFNINENFITEDYIKNKMHISEYYYPNPVSDTESYAYYSINNRFLMNLYRYKVEKEQVYDKIDFETKKFDFDVPNYSKRLLKVEIVGDWQGRLNVNINDKNFNTENGLITCNLVDKFFKYRISGDKVRTINYIKSYFVVEGTR